MDLARRRCARQPLTNATLTAAGQAVVNEALPKRAAFFDESLKGLSAADVETLNRVLSVLEENFVRAAGDKVASAP